ncbi:hypothetical protein CYY_001446 [Polysphondylium violaceum]|uniref:EGF-like domain-containing protein n=1 Tax=Polysphondylium violaceum TaxID=133409 RepID=A0A8J4Q1Z9_9MYCE|nr:hypothetical protein CYY_001446 [Polysphondylium violaceum]
MIKYFIIALVLNIALSNGKTLDEIHQWDKIYWNVVNQYTLQSLRYPGDLYIPFYLIHTDTPCEESNTINYFPSIYTLDKTISQIRFTNTSKDPLVYSYSKNCFVNKFDILQCLFQEPISRCSDNDSPKLSNSKEIRLFLEKGKRIQIEMFNYYTKKHEFFSYLNFIQSYTIMTGYNRVQTYKLEWISTMAHVLDSIDSLFKFLSSKNDINQILSGIDSNILAETWKLKITNQFTSSTNRINQDISSLKSNFQYFVDHQKPYSSQKNPLELLLVDFQGVLDLQFNSMEILFTNSLGSFKSNNQLFPSVQRLTELYQEFSSWCWLLDTVTREFLMIDGFFDYNESLMIVNQDQNIESAIDKKVLFYKQIQSKLSQVSQWFTTKASIDTTLFSLSNLETSVKIYDPFICPYLVTKSFVDNMNIFSNSQSMISSNNLLSLQFRDLGYCRYIFKRRSSLTMDMVITKNLQSNKQEIQLNNHNILAYDFLFPGTKFITSILFHSFVSDSIYPSDKFHSSVSLNLTFPFSPNSEVSAQSSMLSGVDQPVSGEYLALNQSFETFLVNAQSNCDYPSCYNYFNLAECIISPPPYFYFAAGVCMVCSQKANAEFVYNSLGYITTSSECMFVCSLARQYKEGLEYDYSKNCTDAPIGWWSPAKDNKKYKCTIPSLFVQKNRLGFGTNGDNDNCLITPLYQIIFTNTDYSAPRDINPLDIIGNDKTIEMWLSIFNLTSSSAIFSITGIWYSFEVCLVYSKEKQTLKPIVRNPLTGNVVLDSNTEILVSSLNEFFHFAVIVESNVLSFYINGERVSRTLFVPTESIGLSPSFQYIGGKDENAIHFYINEYRTLSFAVSKKQIGYYNYDKMIKLSCNSQNSESICNGKCVECVTVKGFVFNQAICSCSCPEFFENVNGVCLKKCLDGLFRDSSSMECKCLDGYYKDPTGTCVVCKTIPVIPDSVDSLNYTFPPTSNSPRQSVIDCGCFGEFQYDYVDYSCMPPLKTPQLNLGSASYVSNTSILLSYIVNTHLPYFVRFTIDDTDPVDCSSEFPLEGFNTMQLGRFIIKLKVFKDKRLPSKVATYVYDFKGTIDCIFSPPDSQPYTAGLDVFIQCTSFPSSSISSPWIYYTINSIEPPSIYSTKYNHKYGIQLRSDPRIGVNIMYINVLADLNQYFNVTKTLVYNITPIIPPPIIHPDYRFDFVNSVPLELIPPPLPTNLTSISPTNPNFINYNIYYDLVEQSLTNTRSALTNTTGILYDPFVNIITECEFPMKGCVLHLRTMGCVLEVCSVINTRILKLSFNITQLRPTILSEYKKISDDYSIEILKNTNLMGVETKYNLDILFKNDINLCNGTDRVDSKSFGYTNKFSFKSETRGFICICAKNFKSFSRTLFSSEQVCSLLIYTSQMDKPIFNPLLEYISTFVQIPVKPNNTRYPHFPIFRIEVNNGDAKPTSQILPGEMLELKLSPTLSYQHFQISIIDCPVDYMCSDPVATNVKLIAQCPDPTLSHPEGTYYNNVTLIGHCGLDCFPVYEQISIQPIPLIPTHQSPMFPPSLTLQKGDHAVLLMCTHEFKAPSSIKGFKFYVEEYLRPARPTISPIQSLFPKQTISMTSTQKYPNEKLIIYYSIISTLFTNKLVPTTAQANGANGYDYQYTSPIEIDYTGQIKIQAIVVSQSPSIAYEYNYSSERIERIDVYGVGPDILMVPNVEKFYPNINVELVSNSTIMDAIMIKVVEFSNNELMLTNSAPVPNMNEFSLYDISSSSEGILIEKPSIIYSYVTGKYYDPLNYNIKQFKLLYDYEAEAEEFKRFKEREKEKKKKLNYLGFLVLLIVPLLVYLGKILRDKIIYRNYVKLIKQSKKSGLKLE